MSLGWQCESALLPSKSKPINVDGKSMVGLKALLYNEEQHKSGGSGPSSRQQRRPKAHDAHNDSIGNKTVHKKEPAASETNDKEAQAYQALQAKAKLYEEIANGKSQLQSDVVDFGSKTIDVEQPTYAKQAIASQAAVPPPPKPPSCRNPFASQTTGKPTVTTEVPNKTANDIMYAPFSTMHTKQEQPAVSSQPQWSWSTTYATTKTSSTDAYERNVGAASTCHNADTTSTYASQVAAERELKRVIAERVQEEQKNTLSTVSEGARVKTQWEKTLNSSARSFLDEIHEDATVQREVAVLAQSAGGATAEAGTKRSLKEERLELIRQKRLRL